MTYRSLDNILISCSALISINTVYATSQSILTQSSFCVCNEWRGERDTF